MRLNLQGWDSLALDGKPLDRDVSAATHAVFANHLESIRVRGLAEISLFVISSGEKSAPPSRMLDLRYYAKKRKLMCRWMLAPTARSPTKRTAQYLDDMARLTRETFDGIATRLGEQTALTQASESIARDLIRLMT